MHSKYICNHDSIIGGRGIIVLALASPYYNKVGTRITRVKATPTNLLHIHNTSSSNISSKSSVVDTKEIVKRSKRKRETMRRAGDNGHGSGNVVLALASPSYYEVGTRITRVKATPTNSLHIHTTTSSNISGKSSVVDAKEIVKRSKRKRETVSRVGGVPRVSPYFFKDKLMGNTNSSLTGNVDTHCVGNLIMRNENKCGNNVLKESEKNVPKGDFLVKRNKRRKNNAQDNRLPHEHENRNASTSDGCQEESDVGINTVSAITKEKKKNKKEKKRKNPPSTACRSVISLEGDSFLMGSRNECCLHESQGCSQVSIVRKVSPFFRSKTEEKDHAFVISSVSPEHQSAADLGVYTAEIDVEDANDKNNMKNECVSNGKTQKPYPCSENLNRKKVKNKKNHDLASDFGQEDSDNMIHKMSGKTKMNKDKAASLTKCSQLKGQECELDACSAGSKKEDNTFETQDCLQGFTIKKVSPYFQLELQSKEPDENNSNVEFLTNRPCRNTSINLEEVLSKYTYKSERMVRRDQASDSAGKKKKKLGARSNGLSAAEKLAEPYKRKDPCNTWKPPRSPHNLLQEDHVHDPWRILVICMLLNITTGSQVKQVLPALFCLCPNAEAAVTADVHEIERVIESLGLQRKRAVMIKKFSREYLSEHWTHVTQLHGIGKYAADAYAIFCNGMWRQITPNDHMLNYYWKFLRNRGLTPV